MVSGIKELEERKKKWKSYLTTAASVEETELVADDKLSLVPPLLLPPGNKDIKLNVFYINSKGWGIFM